MPNHVKNIITLEGKQTDIESFFNTVKSENEDFDFNNLIPQPSLIKLPDNLDGIASDITDGAELLMIHNGWPVYDYNGNQKKSNSLYSYEHKRKWKDEDFDLFTICCKAIMECGYSNWYPWNCVHWGTKWNAYKIKKEGNKIEFQTAWSTPTKIWKKIAEMFPSLVVCVRYADEDYGANCGTITIYKGEVSYKESNTTEFAYSVWDLSDEIIAEIETE